jgi:hypothetical protein
VVPDALHGSASIAAGVDVELVVAKIGVVRGECDVAALGQLQRVVQAVAPADAGRLPLPMAVV